MGVIICVVSVLGRFLFGFVAIGVGSGIAGADPIKGEGSFPQFRSISGLPGGGFGVARDGRMSFNGAMGISTPVAYSLSGYQIVLVGGIYSGTTGFRFDTSEGQLLKSNGTAAGLIGFDLGRYGDLTFSHMVLSTKGDNAQNLHWQVPYSVSGWEFGLGVQDISGQGGTSGQTSGPRGFDPGESRSYYAVGTYDFGQGSYGSVGFGDGRFKGRAFANACYQVDSRLKLIGEVDGFGFNSGVAYDVGRLGTGFGGREIRATVTAGYLRFKNAYWSISVGF